jgi:hypothetical protein
MAQLAAISFIFIPRRHKLSSIWPVKHDQISSPRLDVLTVPTINVKKLECTQYFHETCDPFIKDISACAGGKGMGTSISLAEGGPG